MKLFIHHTVPKNTRGVPLRPENLFFQTRNIKKPEHKKISNFLFPFFLHQFLYPLIKCKDSRKSLSVKKPERRQFGLVDFCENKKNVHSGIRTQVPLLDRHALVCYAKRPYLSENGKLAGLKKSHFYSLWSVFAKESDI